MKDAAGILVLIWTGWQALKIYLLVKGRGSAIG